MDHPRLRGEHPETDLPVVPVKGSPPPARGALPDRSLQCLEPRITPACAGSTRNQCRPPPPGTDHPRLRGEHLIGVDPEEPVRGSPPPARGAPLAREGRHQAGGITPACAGST